MLVCELIYRIGWQWLVESAYLCGSDVVVVFARLSDGAWYLMQ